jgi:hypothetical protein
MTRNPVQDGDFVLAPLFGSLMNAHQQDAVLNGVAPSVGTGDFDVDTTAGNVVVESDPVTVSSNTATLTAPSNDADLDSGEFRVDLLTVNNAGTVNVSEGNAANEPISPPIPTDEVVICAVVVAGDATGLQSADVRDYRSLIDQDARTYKDNDIDTDGDGSVNNADTVGDAQRSEVDLWRDAWKDSGSNVNIETNPVSFTQSFQAFWFVSASITDEGGGSANVNLTVTYSDSTTQTFSGKSQSLDAFDLNKDGEYITEVDFSANGINDAAISWQFYGHGDF